MASFEHNDEGVVVIIGSGAGGGTLAHELTRRGIKVVLLEAGARQSIGTFSQDARGGLRAAHLARPAHAVRHIGAWRANFPTLPSWTCQDRGRHDRALDRDARRAIADVGGHGALDLRRHSRHLADRLADQVRRAQELLPARGTAPGCHAPQRHSGHARLEQLQGDVCRRQEAWLQARAHQLHGDQSTSRARAAPFCIQQGFCAQGCKTGAKWSTLYTEIPRAEATGKLDLRIQSMATRIEHGADGTRHGRRLSATHREGAAPEGARRLCRGQFDRDGAAAAARRSRRSFRRASPIRRTRWDATTVTT